MKDFYFSSGYDLFEFGLSSALAQARRRGYNPMARNPRGPIKTRADQAKATADQFAEYPPSRWWWKGAKNKPKPGRGQDHARLRYLTQKSEARLGRRREKVRSTNDIPARVRREAA